MGGGEGVGGEGGSGDGGGGRDGGGVKGGGEQLIPMKYLSIFLYLSTPGQSTLLPLPMMTTSELSTCLHEDSEWPFTTKPYSCTLLLAATCLLSSLAEVHQRGIAHSYLGEPS